LSSGYGVGLATSIPAATASTGMGDRLRTGKPSPYFIKSARPTQPSTISGTENNYQPKCSDVLWLGNKGRNGYSTCG